MRGWAKVKMTADMDVALVVKYEHRKEKGFMESFYNGERIWDC